MSAIKWMKWLSVIALILAAVSVIGSIWDSGMVDFTEIGLFLATIVLVIISFKKK